MKYVNVELKDTALVIECPECHSAYVEPPPPPDGVDLNDGRTAKCFNGCRSKLVDSEPGRATVVDAYAALLKAKTNIRLRAPIDE